MANIEKLSMPIRVLLVEDEPLIRWIERKELESWGCQVTEAEDCGQAEERWSSGIFDLIILDHRLPDGLGSLLLQDMRARGHQERVIYLSAEVEQLRTAAVADLKVDAVLAKPLDMARLGEVVAGMNGDHAGDGPPSSAGSASEAGSPAAGRFVHVSMGGRVTRNSVLQVESKYRESPWLALDMQNVKHVEEAAFPVLVQLARSCRQAGGRFCLVGLPKTLLTQWSHTGLSQEADILCDVEALESLYRRLSLLAERAALLDSVVPRKEE